MRHEETGGAQQTNTSHVTSAFSLLLGTRAGIFKQSMGAIGTKSELGCHTGPPSYSTWAGGTDSLESIDSQAPFGSDDSREK